MRVTTVPLVLPYDINTAARHRARGMERPQGKVNHRHYDRSELWPGRAVRSGAEGAKVGGWSCEAMGVAAATGRRRQDGRWPAAPKRLPVRV